MVINQLMVNDGINEPVNSWSANSWSATNEWVGEPNRWSMVHGFMVGFIKMSGS